MHVRVEISLSIIVGCLPTLRPLVDKKLRQNRKLLGPLRENSYMISPDLRGDEIKQTTCITIETMGSSLNGKLRAESKWQIGERV